MHSNFGKALGLFLICVCCSWTLFAQSPQYVPFSAAQPILKAYLNSLPADLKPGGQPTAAAWDAWVRRTDQEIRTRLERGEEDTLTNLLRLGVTYTKQERITYSLLERFGKDKYVDQPGQQTSRRPDSRPGFAQRE